MFKVGDRVKVDSKDGEVYGVVVGIDNDVVTIVKPAYKIAKPAIAVGEDRIINSHYESVFHDEGYSKLKGN